MERLELTGGRLPGIGDERMKIGGVSFLFIFGRTINYCWKATNYEFLA